MTAEHLLGQGAGYGVLVGFGALFAVGMWAIGFVLTKFGEVQGSEMFMTAKRSVGTGLVASAVVSSWTIAATLLTSSTWAFQYGVSGAYFYGAGATVQVFIFASAAIELKRRAPGAHTFLEVAKLRYGTAGHIVFITYSSLYAAINCVNILVGGSAVFAALTGINVIAGIWLLPLGVVVYTILGGIKATILTDYSHIIVIYAMVLAGLFVVYADSNGLIGSPDKLFDLLRQQAQIEPVKGNSQGEFLTMRSENGILLGIVLWCAVFGTTIDVQLFQKAITADPVSTLPGYIIGGLSWFPIPFGLATTFGLAARALQGNPAMHTMTKEDIAAGLAFPYAAQALMGKGGSLFVILITFMACTAGFSADIVSISAVFTYDIYRAYFNPTTSGGQLVKMSKIAVIVWSVCMAIIATGLSQTSIGVNYILTCMGVFTCCAAFPIYSTMLWKRQNRIAVVAAPLLASVTAFAAWLGSAYALEGAVTIDTTSQVLPLVIGNVTSLLGGAIYSIIFTFVFGRDTFNWDTLSEGIKVVDDSDIPGVTAQQLAETKAKEHLTPESAKALERGKRTSIAMATGLCLVFMILWPMPMYGTGYVFSKPFFRFWVAITFIFAWVAALTITILPLWEGRHTLANFWRFITLQTKEQVSAVEDVHTITTNGLAKTSDAGKGDEKEGVRVDEFKV